MGGFARDETVKVECCGNSTGGVVLVVLLMGRVSIGGADHEKQLVSFGEQILSVLPPCLLLRAHQAKQWFASPIHWLPFLVGMGVGYGAGNAIPSPQKNVEKAFLKKYWAKWKASHTGRSRAMPHIKTFARFNGQNLAWFLLTSANLSKTAWGALQKNNSQLMIRSYELGVLFLPTPIRGGSSFSCTDDDHYVEGSSCENGQEHKTRLVTLCWQGSKDADSATEVIAVPVPYELPPQPYSSEDIPWSWDKRYSKKDVYGQVWPRTVQLYTSQDS